MGKSNNQICRLCGEFKKMTYEHIPPKSAFNACPRSFQTMQNMLEGHSHSNFRQGMGQRSLCQECNNLTGTWYGAAFAVWVNQAMEIHNRIGQGNAVTPFYLPFRIRPLNVLKQILVMAIAISSPKSVSYHDELRSFLLEKRNRNFPKRYKVHTYFNVGGKPRFASGMAIMGVGKGSAYIEAEVSLPPLGYCITTSINKTKSLPDAQGLYDMTWFNKFEYDVLSTVYMQIPARETHEPFPLDYRTEEEVKAHYEKQGI